MLAFYHLQDGIYIYSGYKTKEYQWGTNEITSPYYSGQILQFLLLNPVGVFLVY